MSPTLGSSTPTLHPGGFGPEPQGTMLLTSCSQGPQFCSPAALRIPWLLLQAQEMPEERDVNM